VHTKIISVGDGIASRDTRDRIVKDNRRSAVHADAGAGIASRDARESIVNLY
jgi:hypothetical protein